MIPKSTIIRRIRAYHLDAPIPEKIVDHLLEYLEFMDVIRVFPRIPEYEYIVNPPRESNW